MHSSGELRCAALRYERGVSELGHPSCQLRWALLPCGALLSQASAACWAQLHRPRKCTARPTLPLLQAASLLTLPIPSCLPLSYPQLRRCGLPRKCGQEERLVCVQHQPNHPSAERRPQRQRQRAVRTAGLQLAFP